MTGLDLMTETFEKIECQGPLCHGVRLRLKSQIADASRGWCFACVEHERSGQRRAAGKIDRAEVERKAPDVAVQVVGKKEEPEMEMSKPKQCRTCKKVKPHGEFARFKQSCKDCQAAAAGARESVAAQVRSKPKTLRTPATSMPPASVGSPIANAAKDQLIVHSARLFRIALRGPRPEDSEFVRSVCAALLQDTLDQSAPALSTLSVAE